MLENMINEFKVYGAFFENSLDAMYISTADGKFLKINRGFRTLLGYNEEDLIDLEVGSVYALPQERRRFMGEMEKRGAVRNFRVKLKDKYDVKINCIVDAVEWKENGEKRGYIGSIKPDRRPHHVARTEEQANFDFAIKGSNDGLWVWDLHSNEVSFSLRWKKILGYDDIEIRDNLNEWIKRIHPDDIEGFKKSLNDCLKGKTPVLTSYFRMKNREGNYQWMMVRGVLDLGDDLKPRMLAGSMCNITGHINVLESYKKKEVVLSEENHKLKEEKTLLSRYFPSGMVSDVLEKGSSVFRSSTGDAFVMLIKVVNYDEVFSDKSTEFLTGTLNEIFVDIMDLIYGHKGSVNKILGDSILATFGCPLPFDGYMEEALSCSMDIRQYMDTLNEINPFSTSSTLVVRTNMSCGDVFSGTFGSVRRLDYSVFGSPVNSSFRMSYMKIPIDSDIVVDSSVYKRFSEKYVFEKIEDGGCKGDIGIYSLVSLE